MNLKSSLFYKTLISTAISVLFYSNTAHAGYEEICQPDFYLNGNSYNKCSNLPALVPSNDNQTNMLFLLSDLGLATIKPNQPDAELWTSTYAYAPFEGIPNAENRIANQRAKFPDQQIGYEERCNTVTSAKTSFIEQVKNNKNMSTLEKQALIAERNKISECSNKLPLLTVNEQWSSTARQYASYLNATIAFYNANFSTATKIYSVLSTVDDAWLKETSQYMLIRSSLNSAYATGIDQYGDINLDKINKNLLKQFLDNITSYLNQLYLTNI